MEYKVAAARSGRPFLPVYLTCEMEENLRRVISAERVSSGTGKLLCREMVENIRSRCQLYEFKCSEGIKLDISHLQPIEAAEILLKNITKL